MSKPVKSLIIVLAVTLVLGAGVWFLLSAPEEKPAPPAEEVNYLVNRPSGEVALVEVSNQNGSYTVTGKEGAYTVEDIPAELVIQDYLLMLLDETSSVQYQSVVSRDVSRAADYGLSEPEAEVKVTYTDGQTLELLIGSHEPISNGRYFMVKGGSEIMIMKNGRSIRFTMPVENYIDYVIVPPPATPSPLAEVQDITISGSLVEQPIVLKAVLPERPELQLLGLSYGALTHLVMEPALHEANPNGLMTLVTQMTGLISEGIVDYNCTEAELAGYGFDRPLLQYDFDYKNGEDVPTVSHTLKVSRLGEDYIVTYDDEGVVYRILDLDFLHIEYNDLVLRWFVSPFISDVKSLTITLPGEEYIWFLSGKDAKDLQAMDKNGAPVDAERFRKLYGLATSAAADGPVLQTAPTLFGEPVLTLRYTYRNAEKQDDVLRFFDAGQRRLYVEKNGVCQSTIRGNFAAALKEASRAFQKGESFSTEW